MVFFHSVISLQSLAVTISPKIMEDPHFECLHSKCELLLNFRIGLIFFNQTDYEGGILGTLIQESLH